MSHSLIRMFNPEMVKKKKKESYSEQIKPLFKAWKITKNFLKVIPSTHSTTKTLEANVGETATLRAPTQGQPHCREKHVA